ncbi:DMT family transporter [Pelagibius litoralis]|uniref:DMT family transporter n=1 Tax=Pelagibius litoralis TaxID=374515 RepID=A0A967K9G4_9PROT|nr:DMT family transporter [Pelagibius litoralis]NIA69852.1 DMT family transporter [Pelagibius litoralis]
MSRDLVKAMAWVTLGAFLFAFMFMLPKLTSAAVAPPQVAFLRYLAGFLIILPFFLQAHGHRGALPELIAPTRRRLNLLHGLRACCGVTSVAFGAYAVIHIPLANAQAIAMANGVFAVLFAALFLKERLTSSDLVAGGVCLAGAVVVAGPDFDAPGWISLGAAAAVVQAVAWGAEVVLLRFTAVNDTTQRTLTLVNGGASLLLLILTAAWWNRLPLSDIATLLAMGPVAIIGQYCNIRGFRLAAAAELVPIKYSGVVFAALLGIVFFDEWPHLTAVLGAVMICAGAGYLAMTKTA